MIPNLLLWLIAAPVLAAALIPILGMALGSARRPLYPVAHLFMLVLAAQALRAGAASRTVGIASNPIDARDVLALDHTTALALLLAALLFLAIGTFSSGFVGPSRQGGTFLSLLLLEQGAVNWVLLAGGLFALYSGLLFLSFCLVAMVGLSFVRGSASVALRVFATPEAPAAAALVSFWLINARAGTAALADLPRQAMWQGSGTSLVLVLPIVVALAARAGLVPFQRWVVVGCRASAVPVAAAIVGLVLPLAVVVLARVAGAAIPLDASWLRALAFLGVATALVGALGALRAVTALGWLGYVGTTQAGFAVVGFLAGTSTGAAAAWLGLASGAVVIVLVALGLGLAMRAAQEEALVGPGQLPASWIARLSLGVGLLALAAVPPFPTFAARRLLLAGLLAEGSRTSDVLAALVVLASLLLAAAVWRAMFGFGRVPVELDGHANGAVTAAELGTALTLTLSQRERGSGDFSQGERGSTDFSQGGRESRDPSEKERESSDLSQADGRDMSQSEREGRDLAQESGRLLGFSQREFQDLPRVERELVPSLLPAGTSGGTRLAPGGGAMVMPWRLRRVDRAPSEWEMRSTLGVLALLVGLAGVAPLTWLGSRLQLALPPSPAGMDLAATALLVLAGVGAVLLYPVVQRLTQWPRPQKRLSRRLAWLGDRYHVDVLLDPYLIVGGILLGLGRASAAVLHHTLGRLARAG